MFQKNIISLAILLSGCAFPRACEAPNSRYAYLHHHPVKLLQLKSDEINEVKTAEIQYNGVIKPFVAPAVDLGMNGVPVLDQGQEGTCVTFSTTAGLDALIGEGDFISQQCSLELDVAMGNNFWDGANAPSQIIDPLQQYGVIAQADCPDIYPNPSGQIALSDYQSLVSQSESAIVAQAEYSYSAKANLAAVKVALGQGNRVLIGIHVYTGNQEAVQGFNVNGKVGGLWACQQGKSANYCRRSMSGHEVLVIGYDDKQQLLKIRNSWGVEVGDAGDYYMTYTFFNSMVMDSTVLK